MSLKSVAMTTPWYVPVSSLWQVNGCTQGAGLGNMTPWDQMPNLCRDQKGQWASVHCGKVQVNGDFRDYVRRGRKTGPDRVAAGKRSVMMSLFKYRSVT